MSQDIKTLLKEATKDLLTEATLNTIQQSFDTAVGEKIKIHVEKALIEQDNDYANKLEKLVSTIDKDHAIKLNRVVEAIDINHTDKLRRVVEGYEKALNGEAGKFKNDVVGTLSKYLDLYLEEKIPTVSIKEAVSNKRANMVLKEVKKILAVDQAMAQESIRDAVLDGKKTIDSLSASLRDLTNKNKQLEESSSSIKANLLVEKSISNLEENKKGYMQKMLKSKSPKYVAENFDYILGLYDKSEQETLDVLTEQASQQTISADAEMPSLVEESVELDVVFNAYLGELRKY